MFITAVPIIKLFACVFITAVPITKLFAREGGGGNGGHVLRETTSRGLCELVCQEVELREEGSICSAQDDLVFSRCISTLTRILQE